MGSHMDANPEQIATMLNAFSEAKRSVIEGIIREHGMEMLVTVMFYLASSNAESLDVENDPKQIFRQYFVSRREEE